MAEKRKVPLKEQAITPEMCSPAGRLEILRRVPFFAGSSPAELSEINRLFHERGFEPGEPVIYEGDPAERFYVVAAGKVKLLRHANTGREILLDLLNPGEFFGSISPLSSEVYAETARAHTSVCTLSIDKDGLRSILSSRPAVALRVLELVTARLQEAQEMVRQLSAYSVEHRIAHTLLKLGDKFGERQQIGLLLQTPLSREDLAEMVGTTPESASRVLSQFQKNGLIESGRQWIAITDRAALEAFVEEAAVN
jgi:CRP/FNR family transcriptional regulator, nitrogen oxide reductase regulator